jgi:hypothetical protein
VPRAQWLYLGSGISRLLILENRWALKWSHRVKKKKKVSHDRLGRCGPIRRGCSRVVLRRSVSRRANQGPPTCWPETPPAIVTKPPPICRLQETDLLEALHRRILTYRRIMQALFRYTCVYTGSILGCSNTASYASLSSLSSLSSWWCAGPNTLSDAHTPLLFPVHIRLHPGQTRNSARHLDKA